MTDLGWYRAVLEDPASRQAYADWLDDRDLPVHAAVQRWVGRLKPIPDPLSGWAVDVTGLPEGVRRALMLYGQPPASDASPLVTHVKTRNLVGLESILLSVAFGLAHDGISLEELSR